MRLVQLFGIAALAGFAAMNVTTSASAQPNCVTPAGEVRVGVAPPPPLPEYAQPPIPAYGYVWTPGYWAWNGAINDYYWIAGAWVAPPDAGLLWTPGYWAWNDGIYVFRAGYWGPHVGFYGGIAYGYGYWGHGYDGGYWQGRTFYYNRHYNNLGAVRINAIYDRRVAGDRLIGRISFNGGPSGVRATATAGELAAIRERHFTATAEQARLFQSSAADGRLRAGFNHGHPDLARPQEHGVNPSTIMRVKPPAAALTHNHPMQATHAERHGLAVMPELRASPSHAAELREHPMHEAPQRAHEGGVRPHPDHQERPDHPNHPGQNGGR